MSDDEQTFETGGSGASATYPQQCSALRKGGYVCIKGKPCKIVDMSTSKTGKHGHAKVHITALDIFDGKKLEENSPSTHNVEVPNVHRKEYQIIGLTNDNFFELLMDDGDVKSDVKFNPDNCVPNTLEKVQQMLKECDAENSEFMPMALVMSAMGIEQVKEVKKVKSS